MIKKLTCIECPMGCSIEVELDDSTKEIKSIKGNSCPRGKMYAENEVVCPRRVLTSTIRLTNGEMLSVKTNKPVKKAEMFDLMNVIRKTTYSAPVKIGDIIVKNITEDIDLVATDNKN